MSSYSCYFIKSLFRLQCSLCLVDRVALAVQSFEKETSVWIESHVLASVILLLKLQASFKFQHVLCGDCIFIIMLYFSDTFNWEDDISIHIQFYHLYKKLTNSHKMFPTFFPSFMYTAIGGKLNKIGLTHAEGQLSKPS